MGRHARSCTPAMESLEARALMTASASSSSYFRSVAQHAYDVFVNDLKLTELSSLATPAQFQALRDDTRALSAAAGQPGATAALASRRNGAITATVLIDRSLLEGWLSDQGWAEVRSRLALDLSGADIPATLIDKTVADMKSAAVSAGVDPGTSQVLSQDMSSFQSARNQAGGGSGFHDPQVYYTQHLRGFFRGWAVQKNSDTAKLDSDIASLTAGSTVVRRDVKILQSIGAGIPSDSSRPISNAYLAVFSQGSPSPSALASFRTTALADLGSSANPSRTAGIDRLIADAPAFEAAAGSNVGTIVGDVQSVVNDGAGSTLNPFKIVVNS